MNTGHGSGMSTGLGSSGDEDGNGRWARLLANIWLMQHDQPATLWPASDLRNTASPIRDEYIAAIKQADMRNFGPLIDLHRRFSE